MKYTKEIVIQKDINTVFNNLTNPEFMVKWQESLESYEKNEDGKWVYTDTHSGKPMRITESILEKKEPTTFLVEYSTNGILNVMNNKLESIDENTTKWTSYNEFIFTNLMMKVIGFFFGGSFQKQTEKDMKAFKTATEGAKIRSTNYMIFKTKAVIFDRDGVIINTEGIAIESVTNAFKQLGFTVQEEDIAQTIGSSSRVYKEYFLKKWDFNFEEYRDIQKELFYANLHKAEYFQHTIDLIKNLHKKKIPMAVTTSAGKEGTLLILDKVGIADMFGAIVTKDDCVNLKPDPEPYLTTSKKLGIEPEFCVVMEDTALGVEAAKKAGMVCIAIPNEFTKDQDFSLADAILDSAKEAEDLLEFV